MRKRPPRRVAVRSHRESVLIMLMVNWLQVLGTAELAQVDQGIREQLHRIVVTACNPNGPDLPACVTPWCEGGPPLNEPEGRVRRDGLRLIVDSRGVMGQVRRNS